MSPPRVVILGAGFGGLTCARALSGEPVRVILIDRNNYHLFTPLLYQVASSLLNPSDIAYPVRTVFRRSKNVRFRVGEADGIDFDRKFVRMRDGDVLPYDFLVIATGSATNYFGMRDIEAGALGLKDMPEALQLRNHILRCFEAASREPDPVRRRRWLTFVVVGGGPTGIEYAGALAELVRLELGRDFPELDMAEVRIILLEATGRLLAAFSEELGEDARRRLERRRIEVRLDTPVEATSDGAVRLSGGQTLETETLVWAAGVKPGGFAAHIELPATRSGRIRVDEYLRVPGREGVFAIGDVAGAVQDGTELPMLSAPAMQEARSVARNILAELRGKPPKPFRYRDKGIMATIGRNAAVAEIGRFKLRGFLGWLAWLLVHLYFIIGFRNRLWVLAGWAWNYFFYDRPIRLIVGSKRYR
ncbi:MAG: NAD(P)/FAD-dependent oxidoreductase [Gemmatimonadota bacterium]